jgi:RNA polymerase sigma factor (sigma-70 family)
MTADQRNDIDLIEDIRRGVNPTGAYRVLVGRYKDYAFTLAYRILNNREDAEEAAQDAFVKVFKGLSGFTGASKFSTWLYRIVVNAAITIKNRGGKIVTNGLLSVDSGQLSVDSSPQLKTDNSQRTTITEQRYYIQKALALLSADDVKMISLFYLQEMSLEEVAEASEIEVNTVKVKLHRARKRLAEVLQELLPGEAKNLY